MCSEQERLFSFTDGDKFNSADTDDISTARINDTDDTIKKSGTSCKTAGVVRELGIKRTGGYDRTENETRGALSIKTFRPVHVNIP